MKDQNARYGTRFTTTDTYPLFRRLERLVRRLIGRRFESAADIWQLQVDTLALQQDIQEHISKVKPAAKRDKEARLRLESLRYLRSQARRFGDAIAWAILGNERQLIYPLARNQQVSIGQRNDHGYQGMIAIAAALGSRGWGFPLIHDVTDCLRVGDITFVKPGTDPALRERHIKTVEVKTSLVDKEATEDGRISYKYNITLHSAFDIRPEGDLLLGLDIPNVPIPTASPRALPPRIERQLERLGTAKAHQEAEDDALTVFGQETFINAVAISNHPSYWKSIRRVVRNARKLGYSSECVENTFLYVAFYREGGVDETAVQEPKLATDLVNSGLLIEGDKRRTNAIVLDGIPLEESKGPALFLPYFLYSLPQNAIIDLLYGRLSIIIITNRGRIAEALEKEGFQVRVSQKGSDPYDSFVVSGTAVNASGSEYRVEFHNLHQHIREMVYEFKGVQYLIDIASKMLKVAHLGIRTN